MENALDKAIADLGEENLYFLDEEIDVSIQEDYFRRARKIHGKKSKEDVMHKVPLLKDTAVSINEKKHILSQLASLDDVESFRILEKERLQFDNEELNTWSILAYSESRMNLNASFKEEQQALISTGLGGKDGKLRYFIALLPHEKENKFTETQRDFIKKELIFTSEQNQVTFEKLVEDTSHLISFKVLIPIKVDIRRFFKKMCQNCNELMPLIGNRFIVTNVREMSKKEIEKHFKRGNSTVNENVASQN